MREDLTSHEIEELVLGVDAFARRVAGRALRGGQHPVFDFEDMLQEARLGAVKAAHIYDRTRGNFLTIASRKMKSGMSKAYRRAAPVNVPADVYYSLSKEDRVKLLWWAKTSTADPVSPNSETTVEESLVSPDSLERLTEVNHGFSRVAQMLTILTDRERTAILYLYGVLGFPPLTGEQAAERMGVTRARVSQLHLKAIAKLQKAFRRIRPVK